MVHKAIRNVTTARQVEEEKLTVIIPAAGIGRRMKHCGPKALLQLPNNLTILEHQVHTIHAVYPKAEILVVVGFQFEKFLKYFKHLNVRFIYNPLYTTSNVLGSIASGFIASHCNQLLIVYGDLYFNLPAIQAMTGAHSTTLIAKYVSKDDIGVIVQDSICTNFGFDIEKKWGQVIFLRDKELALLEKIVLDSRTHVWYGYEALNTIIENGGVIRAFESDRAILKELDTPKDLEELKHKWSDYK